MFSRQREHLGSGLRQFGQLVACRQYNSENMAVQHISHIESFLKRNVKFHIYCCLETCCLRDEMLINEHSIEHGVTQSCTNTTQFADLVQFLIGDNRALQSAYSSVVAKGKFGEELPTLQVSIFKNASSW